MPHAAGGSIVVNGVGTPAVDSGCAAAADVNWTTFKRSLEMVDMFDGPVGLAAASASISLVIGTIAWVVTALSLVALLTEVCSGMIPSVTRKRTDTLELQG